MNIEPESEIQNETTNGINNKSTIVQFDSFQFSFALTYKNIVLKPDSNNEFYEPTHILWIWGL